MRMPLGSGPVSWGVDFADQPDAPRWEIVFEQIAAAGYTWAELGPVGYVPADHDLVRRRFEAWGLGVAGSFLFEPLHDPARREAVLADAERAARAIGALDGRFLVIIDRVSPTRAQTAGRSEPATRLGTAGRQALYDTIGEVARVGARHGLEPVVHPHVGSYIEFEDEIDGVLAAFGPAELGLCLDTGHAAYAGIDPVALLGRHAERVRYTHFKDVDGLVLDRVVAEEIPFFEALPLGIFCPLGAGRVDLAGYVAALDAAGYAGPGTVEQDRRPDTPGDPFEAAVASRRYLEAVGVVSVG